MFVSKETINEIKDEIKELKRQVIPETRKSLYEQFMGSLWFSGYQATPLHELVNKCQERMDKLEKLINLMLENQNLEYVKITEENDRKETKEVLRKKSKKSKRFVNIGLTDYED